MKKHDFILQGEELDQNFVFPETAILLLCEAAVLNSLPIISLTVKKL